MDRELEELIQRAETEWHERFVGGPEHLRWEALPPQMGDPAPDLEIQDATGRWRQLREFWADGPALLLFWRHFGCGCGIDRAKRLAGEYDEYVAAGARVAIVGEGDPERGAEYADAYDLDPPILCDPDGNAHETYGLLDFAPPQMLYWLPEDSFDRYRTAAEEFAREYDEKYRADDRPLVDNPWRQPGEFVVDGEGVLQLAYRYQYCEDYPDPRVLETAIQLAGT